MSAPAYVPASHARATPGLRLVLGRGMPGPWSIAARAIFDIKGLPFVAIAHDAGAPNDEIVAWTNHASAPIALLDDHRPRTGWAEILLLAEAMRADPPLIPRDPEQRMAMFGLSHELCGEDGFGWAVRAIMLAEQQAAGNAPYPSLIDRYSSLPPQEHHVRRLNEILELLARRLAAQQAHGSRYLIGDRLSAADIYWTAFSNMVSAMPESACTMPDFYRQLPDLLRPHITGPLEPALLRHREHILEHHLETPLCL